VRRGATIVVVCVLAAIARADVDRIAQLARELTAVHELGAPRRAQLARDVYEAARTRCHATLAAPPLACLAEAATALCHDDEACIAAADVIAANTRAANDWVDESTRARLARGSADYRAALAIELERRYAALAAELALAGGSGDAASIDRFCHHRDDAIHACRSDDALCLPSLSWSRCAAALVWYVGSQP
jgi:hypothetical protein